MHSAQVSQASHSHEAYCTGLTIIITINKPSSFHTCKFISNYTYQTRWQCGHNT